MYRKTFLGLHLLFRCARPRRCCCCCNTAAPSAIVKPRQCTASLAGRWPLPCCSLMHGLAMQFLRSDWQLENLAEHDETKLPPWVRCA